MPFRVDLSCFFIYNQNLGGFGLQQVLFSTGWTETIMTQDRIERSLQWIGNVGSLCFVDFPFLMPWHLFFGKDSRTNVWKRHFLLHSLLPVLWQTSTPWIVAIPVPVSLRGHWRHVKTL